MKNLLFLSIIFGFYMCTPKIDSNAQSESTTVESIKYEKKTITFLSNDGLSITADTYLKNSNDDFILLCHQAGYSRGEYIETAPILVEMGFNILATDQRSGNEVNGVKNETKKTAIAQGKATEFLDARQDIEAAIDKAYKMNGNNPIYLVGSSYSAALVLIIAKDNDKVKKVAAFSPGEYLKGLGVTKLIAGYTKPVFVTSSQKETLDVAKLVSGIDAKFLSHFKSQMKGIHGSRALWESTGGHEAYWKSFRAFLKD